MSDNAIIIGTDESCLINGVSWKDIPTLVWPEGIDEAASDWLRTIVVEYGVLPSTAKEYAKILRPYLRFCRAKKRLWSTADDAFLIIWREHLHRRLGVAANRVLTSLKIIFAFYRWAEESKRIQYHVGIYAPDELPLEYRGYIFPISAKRSAQKSTRSRLFGQWTTTIGISGKSKSAPMRHTPTEEEIQKLHELVVDTSTGERDSLMFSWAEETGIRRAELLGIRKEDLPTPEQLDTCISSDESWIISVVRKGGSKKPISVPPDLIIRTMEYIDESRAAVVQRCQAEIGGYREPQEIFISSTTGMPLHKDSVTSIGRKAFKRAGIPKASGHRLRARFAVRTLETLVDALFTGDLVGPQSSWVETILIKAAEMMGQSSPGALRPYLTYVLNRRIQASDSAKAGQFAAKLRQMTLREATLVARLKEHAELQEAARFIRAGDLAQAADLLQTLVDGLRVRVVA